MQSQGFSGERLIPPRYRGCVGFGKGGGANGFGREWSTLPKCRTRTKYPCSRTFRKRPLRHPGRYRDATQCPIAALSDEDSSLVHVRSRKRPTLSPLLSWCGSGRMQRRTEINLARLPGKRIGRRRTWRPQAAEATLEIALGRPIRKHYSIPALFGFHAGIEFSTLRSRALIAAAPGRWPISDSG